MEDAVSAITVNMDEKLKALLDEFKNRHWPIIEKARNNSETFASLKDTFEAFESGELCLFDFKQASAPCASEIVISGVFSRSYLDFLAAARARVGMLH